MVWSVKYGDTRKDRAYLEKLAAKRGAKLPDVITDQPQVSPRYAMFMQAFIDCSSCRAIGMAVGPIPWRDVMAWCDRRGLNPDQAEAVWAVIRNVDGAWLEAINATHQPGKPRKKD